MNTNNTQACLNITLNIALIGCGRMGSALLRGWMKDDNHQHNVYILEPYDLPDEFSKYLGTRIFHAKNIGSFQDFDIKPDIAVLAVKPQVMEEACILLEPFFTSETLIVSIAAGQTISKFEHYFSENHPVIRAMPNTPAAIGAGITVCVSNGNVTETQQQNALSLLSVTGTVEMIEDENLMDAVTAVSGSGPAYIFLMIEVMERAAQDAGLSKDLSQKLARETVIGSALLAKDAANTPASILRENVTSPGGTTEAALRVLMSDDALQNLMTRAINAAKDRGKALR